MEHFLLKLFDIRRIPTKFIFVIWISTVLIFYLPDELLKTLRINDFLIVYGKYVGITLVVSTGFLFVVLLNFTVNIILSIIRNILIKRNIIKNINNLDIHEKSLIREFYIFNKDTLQLPIDNETVVGLSNKLIIYQASSTGFSYIHGSYFSFSLSKIAKDRITYEMINLPNKFTEEDIHRIQDSRPEWAKSRSRIDALYNGL